MNIRTDDCKCSNCADCTIERLIAEKTLLEAECAEYREVLSNIAYIPNKAANLARTAGDALHCKYAGKKMLEVIDCAREVADILNDYEARMEIDSYTGQPLKKALAALDGDK